MAKAYWVSCYREITDAAKLAAYAKLAGPALEAAGGRFLARGTAAVWRSARCSSNSNRSTRRSPHTTAPPIKPRSRLWETAPCGICGSCRASNEEAQA